MLPPRKSARGPFIEMLVVWSTRHRVAAIGGWFGLVAVSILASMLVTGPGAPSLDPGESGRAEQALNRQHGDEPPLESVLVQRRTPDRTRFRDSAALRAATTDLVTALRGTGAVTDVRSPLDRDDSDHVSADGRSGLVTFRITGPDAALDAHYRAAVRAVSAVAGRHPAVRLAQSGDITLSRAVDAEIGQDFGHSEVVSLPLAFVILLLVFGALIAAGIPVLLTLTSVAATLSLLQIVDQWVPVNSAASAMVLLIGVAVGIDYSLFYLRREREERVAGRDVRTALRITAGTSGRVVVTSGLTVMLCVSGLALTGIGNLQGLAVGTALIVGLAMVGSVTVLPALLATLGRWVDRPRVPWLGRRQAAARPSRGWAALARAVVRRPLRWGGAATAVLVLAALPALGMRLQDAAVTDSLPRSVPAVDAALRMNQAFPGAATPARVVVWLGSGERADTPLVRAAIDALRGRIATGPVTVVRVDRALVVRVPLPGSGTDPVSDRALATLRDTALPATLGTVPGVDYAVAGRTAFAHDFVTTLAARMPLVIGVVLALGFVLLMVAFRSLPVALISIGLNLLSVGAAYGVLTWGFQDAQLGGLLGFTGYGGIVSWLPLFLFVLLFGLSMDYHIFILSRIRERRAGGAGARDSIVDGIASSAGVVTSAALIMTATFAIFVRLGAIEYKMLGVGMAVAVLVDATVVRGVLLPAAMSLLGDRVWRERPAGRPGRRVATSATR